MNLNLKEDLTDFIKREIRFAEIELVRLSQDSNTEYEEKLQSMGYQLEKIAVANGKLGAVNQYFVEPQQPQQPQPQNGASHVE
jgi:hypothetical protein